MAVRPLPHSQRAATARKLGTEAANAAEFKANEQVEDFSARALEFIRTFILAQSGPVPGEDITLAAKAVGIRPADDRAFGSIYAKAIRLGYIRVWGYCPRVRGHGTSGGKLYVRGGAE